VTAREGDPARVQRPRNRVLLACLIAIPLAVLSGAQALSSALLRRAPELALAVFPANGLAAEEAAFRWIAAGAVPAGSVSSTGPAPDSAPQRADLARGAASATAHAKAAIRREPLAARAFVLLALAESDDARRRSIVLSAAQLTRRDPTLQNLLVEEYGRSGDYAGIIGTLDAILRVHPEQRDVFFPALVKTLAEQPAAIPAFARLLAQPLPWREAFLGAAVSAPGAPENLAAVRERITLNDRAFDRKLVARLAADGRLEAAERLYVKVAGPQISGDGTEGRAGQAWRADFPPFDWQLADQAGFRAQSGEQPGTLEIAVRPGNGGVIAERVLRNPGAAFTLRVRHKIEPQSQTTDLRLKVGCGAGGEPFFDRPFTGAESVFSVERPPACPFLWLTITARAWTGGREMKAVIEPLAISAGVRGGPSQGPR
jgi:hypothetical protein